MNRPALQSTNRIRNLPLRTLLTAALLAGMAGGVHAEPPGPHGPPGPPPVPSAEELATVPSLTSAQQIELRKILVERRDAHEAVRAKTQALMEAQRSKDRSEHERIDERSSDRVRSLLGDDGFRSYAQWQLAQRGPFVRGEGPGPRGARPGKPGERPDPPSPRGPAAAEPASPPPPPPAGDDATRS